jgi:hypothetical protein
MDRLQELPNVKRQSLVSQSAEYASGVTKISLNVESVPASDYNTLNVQVYLENIGNTLPVIYQAREFGKLLEDK